jgi:hypothetical protein
MADEQEQDRSKDPNWMQNLWRPMMGWMYMLICLLDMAVFPVLWSLLQATMHMPITQWNPLTLQGAGLFHIAMGAVLGISAFGRTQEKLAGTAANPTATTQTVTQNGSAMGGSNMGGGFGGSTGGFGNGNTTTPATGFGGGATAFGAPAAGGFGNSGGFGSPAPAAGGFGTPASTGFGSSTGFGTASTAPATAPVTGQVAMGFGGKPAPVMAPDPVI